MIRNRHYSEMTAMLAAVLLVMTMLGGCGRREEKQDAQALPAETGPQTESASQAEVIIEPVPAAAAEAEALRQDGERFEDVIILEGMEETVRYEHVKNEMIGFEMDYDYENFVRYSETDRERFVSNWDDPNNPENYLEVRYSPLNAEAAAEAISETLSKEYEISRDDAFMLEGAGRCIRIDASEVKGGGWMPDQLQAVYVIPAGDGCRVAAAHYAIEGSEGFGRRFRYMMDSFSAVNSGNLSPISGTWQTASMGYADDGSMSPEYYVRFTESGILYGHLKDGQFVLDHSDQIVSIENITAGRYKVQAEASNGVQYTYRTSESDENILEYYETWREEEFAETYRGGASLNRIN